MTDEIKELQETFEDKLPMIKRFSQFMAGKNEDLYQEGLISSWRGLLKDPKANRVKRTQKNTLNVKDMDLSTRATIDRPR